jgi:hypothetical protein
MHQKDPATYKTWLTKMIRDKATTYRAHGFRYRGQYEEEIADLATAGIVGGTAGEQGPAAASAERDQRTQAPGKTKVSQ